MQNSLLIEIGTEELPPKQLLKLAKSMQDGITKYLSSDGFDLEGSVFFASPRRLAVYIKQINFEQEAKTSLVFGPMVEHAFDSNDKPKPAATGFAKKFGVSVDDLVISDTPKGKRLAFNQSSDGKSLDRAIPQAIDFAIKQLPQQRWMHWEDKSWLFVRPVHWFLCLFGSQVLECELFDKKSSNKSFGHRFYTNEAITIPSANEYIDTLRDAQVIASPTERRGLIEEQISALEAKHNIKALVSEDLLEEISALVEFPNTMVAEFKKEFLGVPREVLITSMQEHQKCIATTDKDKNLSNKFIVVSNMQPQDPQNIISGNERVMNARLSDAAFYFNQDKKISLEKMAESLENVVFFEKLGTLKDKTKRLMELSKDISSLVSADADLTQQASQLAKADLMSEMVGEFPELQGTMGKYYAKLQQKPQVVASAIEEHYLPRFAKDNLPESQEGLAIALADRLDTLAGFFSLNLQPKKDKDPYGLRRQALAVGRMIIEKEINTSLELIFKKAITPFPPSNGTVIQDFVQFTFDRIKSWLQNQNYQAKEIEAAASAGIDNLLDFYSRLQAIKHFANNDSSTSLCESNKRVKNILSKNGVDIASQTEVDETLFETEAEKNLYRALQQAQRDLVPLQQENNYKAIIDVLITLKSPIDSFFEDLMVMCDDLNVRENRVKILASVRKLFLIVGDISLL